MSMPNDRRDGMVKVTIWIRDELKDAAKKRAAERGTNLSEAIRKYLERYVK